MSDIDRIWALREERAKAKLLLDSYNDVREHIKPKLSPGSITMCMLDEQRAALDIEVARLSREMRAIRDACAHAWEWIGGITTPFEQCVNCGATQEAGTAHPDRARAAEGHPRSTQARRVGGWQVSKALDDAFAALRDAQRMKPGDPMRYAAWRRATYLANQLEPVDFDRYMRARLADEDDSTPHQQHSEGET